MHKKKNCIYVLSLHPVFNGKAAPKFENLSLRDSTLLYSHLLANFIEIFADTDLSFELVFCLNEKDENYIPKNFFSDDSKIFFNTSENINSNLEQLEQNYFSIFENKFFQTFSIESKISYISSSLNSFEFTFCIEEITPL